MNVKPSQPSVPCRRRPACASCACWWWPAQGIAAGAIAEKAEVSASNVSFHLKELERAGLAAARRDARSIIYSAEYEALSGLIRFLMEDCCGGHPEVCAPVVTAAACCTPSKDIVQ